MKARGRRTSTCCTVCDTIEATCARAYTTSIVQILSATIVPDIFDAARYFGDIRHGVVSTDTIIPCAVAADHNSFFGRGVAGWGLGIEELCASRVLMMSGRGVEGISSVAKI